MCHLTFSFTNMMRWHWCKVMETEQLVTWQLFDNGKSSFHRNQATIHQKHNSVTHFKTCVIVKQVVHYQMIACVWVTLLVEEIQVALGFLCSGLIFRCVRFMCNIHYYIYWCYCLSFRSQTKHSGELVWIASRRITSRRTKLHWEANNSNK